MRESAVTATWRLREIASLSVNNSIGLSTREGYRYRCMKLV